MNKQSANILESQAIAGIVLGQIQQKAQEQSATLANISADTAQQMQASAEAFNEANSYIEKARDFVSPENLPHILGPDATKHGEIAESLEVNFRNGRDVLNHLKATARFLEEGKDRIGPTDYVINGSTPVQSKFINGGDISTPNNSLSHIYEHLQKYPGYATDAAPYGFPGQQGIYQMPKDQYDVLLKVVNGDTEGLSRRTIDSCHEYINKIESETGKSITDVVKPGVANYKDVQLGHVDKTIDAEEQSYAQQHNEEVKSIREHDKEQRVEAQHITDASWNEAFKAAGIGAAISGTVSAGLKVFQKIKNGTPITQFTLQDWKEVGIDFAKGGIKGGVTGASVYGLTKLGGFSAPFAGSIVTTSIGITSLLIDYKKGKITKNDFADAACALSVESGLSAVGAAIGQAMIPVPVIGGIVGTVVAQSAYKVVSSLVGDKEKDLIVKMEEDLKTYISKLDKECRKLLNQVNEYFDKLGGLIEAALSIEPNQRLNGSIELARYCGVPKDEIINNTFELDDFMTK